MWCLFLENTHCPFPCRWPSSLVVSDVQLLCRSIIILKMRTLWKFSIYLTILVLLIFHSLPPAEIVSHTPEMHLQLEFVENENLTEIYLFMSRLNSSFASLITVGSILLVRPLQLLLTFSFVQTWDNGRTGNILSAYASLLVNIYNKLSLVERFIEQKYLRHNMSDMSLKLPLSQKKGQLSWIISFIISFCFCSISKQNTISMQYYVKIN